MFLLVVASESSYETIKIPYGFSLFPLTCEEIFNKIVKFKYIENSGTYAIYKNKVVFGHYCKDENGDYYLGYGQH